MPAILDVPINGIGHGEGVLHLDRLPEAHSFAFFVIQVLAVTFMAKVCVWVKMLFPSFCICTPAVYPTVPSRRFRSVIDPKVHTFPILVHPLWELRVRKSPQGERNTANEPR